MPGPNLESMESDLPMDLADDDVFGGIHNVIYKATSQAFREYREVLEKFEKHQKEGLSAHRRPASLLSKLTITVINFILAKALSPKQRLLCSPIIRGYCLTSKLWGKNSI